MKRTAWVVFFFFKHIYIYKRHSAEGQSIEPLSQAEIGKCIPLLTYPHLYSVDSYKPCFYKLLSPQLVNRCWGASLYSWKYFDVVTPLLSSPACWSQTRRWNNSNHHRQSQWLYKVCSVFVTFASLKQDSVLDHNKSWFLEGGDGKYHSQCILHWFVKPLKLLTTLEENKHISLDYQ